MPSAVPWELSSNENRPRNSQTHGGYRPPRPPTSWAPPGVPPMQQPGYGYVQPGSYPQYNLSQSPYGGYLPPTSTSWDQSSNPSAQQTTQVTGYDYYTQQQQQQQIPPPPPPVSESSTPSDNNSYNYSQIPPTYSSAGLYGDSAAYSQQPYAQPGPQTGYTQDTQQGHSQGQSSTPQQGYGAQQPGYGMPPTSQPGYLPAGQTGYGQKPTPAQAAYPQGQQPVMQGYSQPSPASGYTQPASYGQSYVHQQHQQQQQSYNDSYAGSYTQQTSYSSDTTHGSYEAAASSAQAAAAPSGVAKASPQS